MRSQTTAQLEAEACRLRSVGISYPIIAQRLGYADESGARKAVERGLAAIVAEPAEEVRTQTLARMDARYARAVEILEREHVVVSHGKVVRNEDGEPLRDSGPELAALAVMERVDVERRKLLGLDAETKVNLSGGVTYEIVGIDPEALR